MDTVLDRQNRRLRNRLVIVSRVLALLGILSYPLVDASASHARTASIIIEADSGRVLHAIDADSAHYPASLAKMMALYLVFEALEQGRLRLDQALPVSAEAATQPATKLGLAEGDSITVEDAILGLVTRSANDAATVVAEALGGTESGFARLMTERAGTLGMNHTVFRNASGLPDERQITTARDMATLALALMRNFPRNYHYFATRSFEFRGSVHTNHNRLLGRYNGVDGIKTGYINAQGYNVAISAERNGVRLVGIVLGGRSARLRDRHMIRLLDRGFGPRSVTREARATPEPDEPAVQSAPAPKRKSKTASAPSKTKSASIKVWGIQVGVFARYAQAHLAASRATRLVPELLSKASIAVSKQKGRKLYRARLTGLSKDLATEACAALTQRNVDCMTFTLR
ncbi:MAG: serine hydrolase, partial [Alphaproteobacteria bacterium]